MRQVSDIIGEYDSSDTTGENKITLIEWFQKHPGRRHDITEVHQEVGEELGVGRTRTGQILKELDEESVLESHGEQRVAYQLSEDILIPAKYQARAGVRHLYSVVDIKRWGVTGVFVTTTLIWLLMTLPFWILTIGSLLHPGSGFGILSDYEILVVTIAMSLWLVGLSLVTAVLQVVRSLWKDRK